MYTILVLGNCGGLKGLGDKKWIWWINENYNIAAVLLFTVVVVVVAIVCHFLHHMVVVLLLNVVVVCHFHVIWLLNSTADGRGEEERLSHCPTILRPYDLYSSKDSSKLQ